MYSYCIVLFLTFKFIYNIKNRIVETTMKTISYLNLKTTNLVTVITVKRSVLLIEYRIVKRENSQW